MKHMLLTVLFVLITITMLVDKSAIAGPCSGTKYNYNPAMGCVDTFPSGDFDWGICTSNGAFMGSSGSCCSISACSGSCSGDSPSCPF